MWVCVNFISFPPSHVQQLLSLGGGGGSNEGTRALLLTVFKILRIPSGNRLVQETMRHIGVSVPVVTIANEVEIAIVSARLHRLDDKVDANETLSGLYEVVRALESVCADPLGSTDMMECDPGEAIEQKDNEQNGNEGLWRRGDPF